MVLMYVLIQKQKKKSMFVIKMVYPIQTALNIKKKNLKQFVIVSETSNVM